MIAYERSLNGLPIGSSEWFEAQQALIKSRPLLRECYNEWYQTLLADEASVPADRVGALLELGSGASYLKELNPKVITSDIVAGVADRVIDARQLPFADQSVRAIFMTHSFHHVPDVEKFLSEAQRVLVTGGVISLIEPAHTPFAKFVFSNFHPEPYKDKTSDWKFDQTNAMDDANQALSWVVFKRDRAQFHAKFPHLVIEKIGYLPWFGYLASGGVSHPAFLPRALDPLCRVIDFITRPLRFLFSLHMSLTIRKI